MRASLVPLVVAVAFMISCDSAESRGRRAVRHALKDPDSARFGSFSLVGNEHACLTVNARNAFGGYTGDREALLSKVGESWSVESMLEGDHAYCVLIAEETEKIAAQEKSVGTLPSTPTTGRVANVPSPLTTHVVPSEMVVQAYSSSDEAKAREVSGRLNAGGFDARISPLQIDGKTLYRVRIGRFTDRQQAQRVADQVRQRFRLDTWITN